MQFYAIDIMTKDPITVSPQMTCEEVAETFIENKISGAPVVDKEGNLVGVISMIDVLMASEGFDSINLGYFEQGISDVLDTEGFQYDLVTVGFASDFMNTTVHSVLPNTPIEEVAKMMYDQHIHRIIIVDEKTNKPVGIVSTFDLLKLISKQPEVAAK